MSYLSKKLNKILSWPVYIWLVPYVFLQSFLYFHPFIHGTAGSFYYLAIDPTLFSRDIIQTSAFGTTTYFYKLMHLLLGNNLTNPYYLFWPYFIVCLFIAWGIFSVGKLVAGGRIEATMLLFIFFISEKQLIEGAYVSINRTDFHYQHFTLPIIIFAIFFLLKEKYLPFALLMVASFYFHFKTPIAIGLATVPLLIYRLRQDPKQLKYFLLPLVLMVPRVLTILHQLTQQKFLSLAEKTEYFDLVLHREQMEGAMYFNESGITNLVVYALCSCLGFWSLRFVKDERLRKNIFLCHVGVWFAFGVGVVMRLADHFWGPLGEVVMLAYSRASILGVLLTMSTLSLYFVNDLEKSFKEKNIFRLSLAIFLIFYIGLNTFFYASSANLFVNFLNKKIFLQIAILMIFVIIAVKAMDQVNIREFIFLLFILAFAYVGMKAPGMMYRSYKSGYPYFPLVPDFAFYSKDLYAVEDWIKNNTNKQDLVLVADEEGKEEKDFCKGIYRNRTLRSLWCQDLTSVYGDLSAFREWKRRKALLREYLQQPFERWPSLFSQEKIDYVLSSREITWPNLRSPVFENNSYAVYDVRNGGR